jgi:hypothetical protein
LSYNYGDYSYEGRFSLLQLYATNSWRKILDNLNLAWTRTLKAYKSDELAELEASKRLKAIRDLQKMCFGIQGFEEL